MKFKNKNLFLKYVNVDIESYIHPYVPIPSEYAQRWRHLIRLRDNFRCNICGSKKKIIVHHILPKYFYPKLSRVDNNGITLCEPCEDQAHGRELKSFIPKRTKVPSLKQMIRNRPKLSWWKRFVNKLKSHWTVSRDCKT